MNRLRILHDLHNRRARGGPSHDWVGWPDLYEIIDSSVGVEITNVAEYVARHYGESYFDASAMPALVVPWPKAFVEFDVTPTVFSSARFWAASASAGFRIDRVGFMVTTTDNEGDEANSVRREIQDDLDASEGPVRELEPTGDRLFLSQAMLFLRSAGKNYGPLVMYQWACHHEGRLVVSRDGKATITAQPSDQMGLDILRAVPPVLPPLLMAAAFSHCKNVKQQMEDGRYESRQERRAAERRGDKPPARFYTLRIDPNATASSKRLPGPGDVVKRDLPLHLVRGHFAEYGPEFGKGMLFGRLSGRFWFEAHTRGTEEAGIIGKDYDVRSPKAEA